MHIKGKSLLFPVKIADTEYVASYSAKLVNGEEQLIITRDCRLYLTDGKGGYTEFKTINTGITRDDVEKIVKELQSNTNDDIDSINQLISNIQNILKQSQDEIDDLKDKTDNSNKEINVLKEKAEHDNRDVLDNFTENINGKLLYKNKPIEIETSNILDKATYDTNNDGIVDKASIAKKIENIESAPLFSVYGKSPNGEMGFYEFPIGVINDETNKFQSVRQNAKANEVYTIELISPNKLNDLIIQAYEFIQGEQDVVTTLKEFNNKDANNFYYDKDNVVFTNEGAKIKNEYEVISTKNKNTGFYELDLSQEGFISNIMDISSEGV